MKGDKKKNKKLFLELRTDLSDYKINDELRKWNLNTNISDLIINNEFNNKKKLFSFNSVNFLIHKKNIKTSSTIDTIDFSKFDEIILKSKSTNNNEPINKLLDDDYNSYIQKIKKYYPNFTKNHKYHKHFFFHSNKQYIESKHLQKILNENNEFNIGVNNYKINDKYFERNKEELYSLIKTFEKKVGLVELEILYILSYSQKIFDYVLKNSFYEYSIKYLIDVLEERKKKKNKIKANFFKNNTKIFLLHTKKKNLQKLSYISNIILQFYNKIKLITTSLSFDKERNSIINIQNQLIPIKIKYKGKIKLISLIENEMINVTGIFESKYINSFIIYIDEIMKFCFSIFKIKDDNSVKINLSNKFNLGSLKHNKKNYKYLNNNKEEIIFYHLVNFPYKTKEKIISLLEIYSFIISQNFDITQIQEKLKNIFLIIIQEINDKITEKRIDKLKILGIAFIFLKENFEYLIEIIVNNFGSSPKIFKDTALYILNESKNKIVSLLIIIMEESVSLLPNNFFDIKNKINDIMQEYFSLIDFNFNKFVIQYENDLIFKFFISENEKLNELIEKDEWIQINNFDYKYQLIINITYIDYNIIKKDDLIIKLSNNHNKMNYLECRNEKYKIISTTLFILDFIFQVYYILFYNKNKNGIQTIILQLVKILNNFILKCNSLIIEGIGKIGKNKRIITEKEYILLNSNLSIIQSILFNINSFIIGDNDDDIINVVNKHIKKINLIHLKCLDIINGILEEIKIDIIKKFEKINFLKYPILENENYNEYSIRFNKFEEIYNKMLYGFNDNDIISCFKNIFDKFLIEFKDECLNKSGFGNENMIKQFKNDIMYVKKYIQKIKLINCKSYLEILDNIINISKVEEKIKENELIKINVIKLEKEDNKNKVKQNNNKDIIVFNKNTINENQKQKGINKNKNFKDKKNNKLFDKLNKFTGHFIKNKKKQEKEDSKVINQNLIDLNFYTYENQTQNNNFKTFNRFNSNSEEIVNTFDLLNSNISNIKKKELNDENIKININDLKNSIEENKNENINNNILNTNEFNNINNSQQSENSGLENTSLEMKLILYDL